MLTRKTRTILLLALICIFGTKATVNAQQPRSDPVIIAINAAIDSLKQQPNQFTLDVTVVGAMGTASGGGTGINVEVQGGGPGSQTTGLIARVDGTQVNIAQAKADAVLKQEAEKAVKLLTEIRTALQAPKLDKLTATSKLAEFLKTYVAPVLKSVIEALVKKRLGL
jgi:hypothetical protein